MGTEEWQLSTFCMKKIEIHSNRTVVHSIRATCAHRKDRDALIEQSLCTKYSNGAVTHTCTLEILQLIFTDTQQNRKISSKILSNIGKK